MNLNIGLFIPELLSIGILVYLLLESLISGKKDHRGAFGEMAVGTLILGAALYLCRHKTGIGFGGMLVADSLAFYFKAFTLAVFFVITFIARDFFKDLSARKQEFSLILWCSLIGFLFLASATHLLVMFIGLEILTLSLYITASYLKRDALSIEAGLKYLVLGSVASAFMVFGMGLVYLITGELSFAGIAVAKQSLFANPVGILGLLFIFAGFAFKIAAFPFQLWVPDVYQGAPTPVTTLMSTISKAAGFLLIVRFLLLTVGPLDLKWQHALAVLAILTLAYGSLGALTQTNLKRLMGYSGIAHAGYLMLAVASGKPQSIAAMLYYLPGYAVATLAVFYVLTLVENARGSDASDQFDGLSQTSPFLSGVLFVGLLSLAGIPPLAGFMGKFWIFWAAIEDHLLYAVIAAAMMVVVGMYYYLAVAVRLFFRAPRVQTAIPVSISAKLILTALSLLSILIAIFQGPLLKLAAAAIS